MPSLIYNPDSFDMKPFQLKNQIAILLCVTLNINAFVLFSQPHISSFSPTSDFSGNTVIINGTNFSPVPANNAVYFGAARANVLSSTTTSLSVAVPSGATYQPISVTTGSLTAYSSLPFLLKFNGGGVINTATYGPAIDLTTGLHPNGISIADLDGDGRSDLITANNFSTSGQPATFTVLRNTSQGGIIGFAPMQNFNNGVLTYAVATGDIDGDGKQDVVVSSIADQNISVFKNTGSIGSVSFGPRQSFVTGNSPYSIAVGDIDGDGKPDIGVANATSNTISVFKNTSTAGIVSFDAAVDYQTQLNPQCILMSDLDSDGKIDIAVTNYLSSSFSIFRNTSVPGTISTAARADISCGSGNQPTGISVADFNNDDKPDISVVLVQGVDPERGFSQIFKNQSSPGNISFAFNTSVSGSTSGPAYFSAAGDINGDGNVDLALGVTGNNITKIFENRTTPSSTFFSFIAGAQEISSSPYVVGIADLNGDSKPELVTCYLSGSKISVFENRSGLPAIISFTPASASAGKLVTITGENFLGTTNVSFGGTAAASFTVVNTKTITAVIGDGASGNVAVKTPLGTDSMAGFSFRPPPVITSFTPISGGTGTTVTITGTNFNSATAVSFGGMAATSFNTVSSSTVTAVVGSGATGNVAVTALGGTGSLAGFTFLPSPQIISFNPSAATTGDTVTITGNNFNGITSVKLGGVNAYSFIVLNASTIKAVVGYGSSGGISVSGNGGNGTISGFLYQYRVPLINSFTPASASLGDKVIITGKSFFGVSTISFGGTAVSSFKLLNDSTVEASLGNGSSGNVSLSTPGGAASLPGFIFLRPPAIESIIPSSATVGSVVTITGRHFIDTPADNNVYFGAVRADVITASSTEITVKVPSGVTYKPVSVTVNRLTGYSKNPFIVIFSGAEDYFKATTFIPTGETYPVGDMPKSIEAADLDNDGKPDIITSSNIASANAGISVLRNNSSATAFSLGAKSDYPVGSYTKNVIAADINNDGKLDIITCSQGQPIVILKNISTPANIVLEPHTPLSHTLTYSGVAVHDLDIDGRPDIIGTRNGSPGLLAFRNNTENENFSFEKELEIDNASVGPPINLLINDLDGDGKPEVIIGSIYSNQVFFLKNTSSPGTITFSEKSELPNVTDANNFVIGDIDGDGKPDLILNHSYPANDITFFRNISTADIISFAAGVNIATSIEPDALILQDLDGDGKTDIICTDADADNFVIIKNKSTPGLLSVNAPVGYSPGYFLRNGLALDMDGDSKPEIVGISPGISGSVLIYENRLKKPVIVNMCPPVSGSSLHAAITGTSYQWKVNRGGGFESLSDDANHSGSGGPVLALSNIPSDWYGYQYVCMVDKVVSDTFSIRFTSNWVGSINRSWENPGNWECNQVPDGNTDVFIPGSNVTLGTNTKIRSLTIRRDSKLSVTSGTILNVLH